MLRPRSFACLALVLASACSGESTGDRATPAIPPPRWHAVRAGRPSEANGFTIDARSPCRIALRFEGDATGDVPDPTPRSLRAGSSVTVGWSQVVVEARPSEVSPAEDAGAGRTEMHVLLHRFGFADGAAEERIVPTWTRPGRGRVLFRALVPPVVDEDLPVGTRLELGVAAVADVESGEARLVPTATTTRVKMPSPAAPGDRVTVFRLWLEVLPP
jgi:hypothetical protein